MLDYEVNSFDPTHLLDMFKTAKNVNLTKCVWQLGEDSMELTSVANVRKYVDNLKTVKILCESVRRQQNFDWNVAGVASSHKQLRTENLPFRIAGQTFGR